MPTTGIKETLLRMFPPPSYLTMPAVGLDISNESVKFIELVRTKNGTRVGRFDTRDIPLGVIDGSKIKDGPTLTAFLKKLRVDHGLRFVHTSLPEEHAYFFQTRVPSNLHGTQFRESIASELEENVPINPADAIFDAEIVPGAAKKNFNTVNVAVYPKKIIEEYLDVLSGAGLVPVSFEIESQAFARAVVPKEEKGTVMVVDVGKSKAGLAILNGNALLFTATLGIGGDDFTKVIAKGLDISLTDAEYLKRTKAFMKAGGNEAFFDSLLTSVSALRDEVSKHYQFWLEHGEGGEERARIQKIILTGGNANIIGIAEYFSSTLGVPVRRGNVWINIASFEEWIPPINHRSSFRFGTAIGLALSSM